MHRVTCPECRQHFFEFDGREIFRCPHCGGNCRQVEDGQCEDREIKVYLNPLTGQVSAEVA